MAQTIAPVFSQEPFRRYYQRLQPMLKKPRMRSSTAAVFSFLAISLFAWYAIRPTAQTIIYLKKEVLDKTALNKQMENKITALIEAQTIYETAKDRFPIIKQALPENPDAVILARKLRNLAIISGASVSSMQIPSLPLLGAEATLGAKLTPPQPLEDVPVSLVLTGPYTTLRAFLDGLLTMRRIASINTITVKPEASLDPFSQTLQLSLTLTSYYSTQ